jgi:zinc and cadmium transporter
MLFAWIIGFSLLGSVGATIGAALLLAFPSVMRKKLVPYLISYASGTLLGAAFLGMIPAGLRLLQPSVMLTAVLCGLVLFFILEKLVIWRHCHETDCEVHGQTAPLILIGDAFHNFVDGIVIAAAFLTSIPLGVTAAIAVTAHEVPQEVGDFAILLESGYSPR